MTTDTGESLSFSLHHLSGTKKGRRELFGGTRISIGRGRNNQCSFDAEEDRTVSARHAEIRLEGTAAYLYDTGSLNGTYLNGKRVRRALLGDGDEIGLGREGPRLRFMLHSGLTSDPVQPGDVVPITDLAPRRTTGEEMASAGTSLRTQLQVRTAASRLALVAAAAVVLVLSGIVAWLLIERAGREEPPAGAPEGGLEIIRQNGGGGDPSDGGMARGMPTGVDAAAVLVLGRLTTADGKVVHRELGGGVFVAPGLVATVGPVLDSADAFLSGGADSGARLEILAAPAGLTERGHLVRGFHATDAAELPRLVLLVLAGSEEELPSHRLLTGEVRRGPARLLEPGVGQREVRIGEYLDRAHEPTREPADAWLVRVTGLPPYATGQPLVASGSGADLLGLSIGPQAPGLAVTARAYSTLLAGARNRDPTPLTSDR